jgi:phage tail-like protein
LKGKEDFTGNFRFKVSVDDMEAGFSEVFGLDASTYSIEDRGEDGRTMSSKMPGLTKYCNLTLKCGSTNSFDLYNWIKDALVGNIKRKQVRISLMSEDSNVVAVWELTECFPVNCRGLDFNAQGSVVNIESLELVFEGIKRTQ